MDIGVQLGGLAVVAVSIAVIWAMVRAAGQADGEVSAPRETAKPQKKRARKPDNQVNSRIVEAHHILHREKLMSIENKRELAEFTAQLERARAAKIQAEMQAKQAAAVAAKAARQARLLSAGFRRLRVALAWGLLLSIVGALVGFGFVLADLGWLVTGISAAAFVVFLASLLAIAPGKPVRVAEAASDRTRQTETKHPQVLHDAQADEAAESVETEAVDAAAEAYRQAQAAAAERIQRAKQRARRVSKVPQMQAKAGSILLTQAPDDAQDRTAEIAARRPAVRTVASLAQKQARPVQHSAALQAVSAIDPHAVAQRLAGNASGNGANSVTQDTYETGSLDTTALDAALARWRKSA